MVIDRNFFASNEDQSLSRFALGNAHLRDVLRRVRRRGGEPARPQRTESAAREHAALTHHREATLARHMEWLKAGGFVGAECFWKRLEMALIGGYKE